MTQATPPSITVHFPDPESLRKIADHLREADRADLEAVGHTDVHQVITDAVAGSREAWIARWNGEPQAVFGVTDYPLDDRHGVPWLLSTGNEPPQSREFLKLARATVACWEPMYLSLCNIVGVLHPTAHALLKALGFHPVTEHTVNGHPFTEYARHV